MLLATPTPPISLPLKKAVSILSVKRVKIVKKVVSVLSVKRVKIIKKVVSVLSFKGVKIIIGVHWVSSVSVVRGLNYRDGILRTQGNDFCLLLFSFCIYFKSFSEARVFHNYT